MEHYKERRPAATGKCYLVLAIFSVLFCCAFSAQAEELSPEFHNPTGLKLFEVTGIIAAICLYVYFIRQSIRAGTLTFGLLLLISANTMVIQDWSASWGAYILYNPKFSLLPWGPTKWMTPNKPYALVALYGWYYMVVYMSLLALIRKFRSKFPNFSHTAAVLIVTTPIFYAWDLLLEAFAAQVGWWTYVVCVGPTIVSSKGNWPIIYPIGQFVIYGIIATWFLSNQTSDGRVKFELWFPIDRIRNNVYREMARLGVWILVMHVLYLLFLIIPLVGVRELIIGIPSTYVP